MQQAMQQAKKGEYKEAMQEEMQESRCFLRRGRWQHLYRKDESNDGNDPEQSSFDSRSSAYQLRDEEA